MSQFSFNKLLLLGFAFVLVVMQSQKGNALPATTISDVKAQDTKYRAKDQKPANTGNNATTMDSSANIFDHEFFAPKSKHKRQLKAMKICCLFCRFASCSYLRRRPLRERQACYICHRKGRCYGDIFGRYGCF